MRYTQAGPRPSRTGPFRASAAGHQPRLLRQRAARLQKRREVGQRRGPAGGRLGALALGDGADDVGDAGTVPFSGMLAMSVTYTKVGSATSSAPVALC